MVPRHFWRIAIVTGVLPGRDSEIRGAIVRMAKINTILKRPVNKLFTVESLNITNINILTRFNKTREIFPSVVRVLSILLTTSATTASVERVDSKERV